MGRDVLGEIADKDYAGIAGNAEDFIRSHVSSAGKKGVILGLSGGVDSVVTAVLAKRCFPDDSLALIMPDSKVSPREETGDALKLVGSLGMDYKLLDIGPVIDEFAKILEQNQKSVGNLRARVRMSILYYHALIKDYLVLGSSDKSELLIGYFTKHGDGAADILPIASLYKTQVRRLAEHLGVPPEIVQKKSSPNLWPGHDAEEEIGATYEEVDQILYCVTEGHGSAKDAEDLLDLPREKIERICRMYQDSRHKREPAPEGRKP